MRLLGKVETLQKELSQNNETLMDTYSKGLVDGFNKESPN